MTREIDPDVKKHVEAGRKAIYARNFMTDLLTQAVDDLAEKFPEKLDVLSSVLQGQQARVGKLFLRKKRG